MNLIDVSTCRLKMIVLLTLALLLSACAGTKVLVKEASKERVDTVDAQVVQQYKNGLELQKKGKHEQAIAIYEALHQRHPGYIGPLVNLGIIAMKQERFEEAKHYFFQVIELEAQQKQALNYLGMLARINGEFEQAEVYYRQALAVDPNYPDAVRNLGILLDLYRGRFEEALTLYEHYQSLQTDPDPQIKDWIFDTKNRLQAQ